MLDDATIRRTKRVNGEGLEWCGVYDEQLRRWGRQRLTDAQRREIDRLEGAVRELRLVLAQILALADERGRGTIERQRRCGAWPRRSSTRNALSEALEPPVTRPAVVTLDPSAASDLRVRPAW